MINKSRAARAKTENSSVSDFQEEYRYASHHHLIPLYILSGIAIVTILVLSCFIGVMWQTQQRDSFRPAALNTIQTVESLYVPASVQPAEKKQYIYSANIRFPLSDPYQTLRYAYDPGTAATNTSATITLTTSPILQMLEAPLMQNPSNPDFNTNLQQCAKVYVIRFIPGATPFGNFAPLKDIKLKDGRTVYVHKNTACVPTSVQEMNQLDGIEKNILGVESF
jgi:hypothetical protein